MSRARPPVFVVVPVRDHPAHTGGILRQLVAQGGYERVFVFDNGSQPPTADLLSRHHGRDGIEVVHAAGRSIHAMWADGIDRARSRARDCDIAVLNNDLRLGPRFLATLATDLRSDPALWAVCPRYDRRSIEGLEYVSGTFKDGGLAGFAFMVRGEAFDHVAVDQGFVWWFGDDDLVAQIEQHGHKVAITGSTWVEHVEGGSQTLGRVPGVIEQLGRDEHRMIAKWGRT